MVTGSSGQGQDPQILPKSLFWFPWKFLHITISITFNKLKGEAFSTSYKKTAFKYLILDQYDSSRSEKLTNLQSMYPLFNPSYYRPMHNTVHNAFFLNVFMLSELVTFKKSYLNTRPRSKHDTLNSQTKHAKSALIIQRK